MFSEHILPIIDASLSALFRSLSFLQITSFKSKIFHTSFNLICCPKIPTSQFFNNNIFLLLTKSIPLSGKNRKFIYWAVISLISIIK
eukprot:TRINITY_DN1593_c0_g1_i1.p1 TRINITY_DN1593_c0_g1~~TRINITY_DN1593_c0_g1_i1.p1  ORF type:complete len:87 (+),score=6.62 TRINITY_DN1593_c0_g1_i1:75-335(+)